jgi:hypothetical protein
MNRLELGKTRSHVGTGFANTFVNLNLQKEQIMKIALVLFFVLVVTIQAIAGQSQVEHLEGMKDIPNSVKVIKPAPIQAWEKI